MGDLRKFNVLPGDDVKVYGMTLTIGKVLHQDVDTRYADIEFEDTNGIYRHYKSSYDGGQIVLNGFDGVLNYEPDFKN